MKLQLPIQIDTLQAYCTDAPDSCLIIFSSPEARCLGIAQRLEKYDVEEVCIIRIVDEESPAREKNIRELRSLCEGVAPVAECQFKHSDPIYGLDRLTSIVLRPSARSRVVSVDISTFPRKALLLTLRALERSGFPIHFRILYSEPGEYSATVERPLSYGLKQVRVVPTFVAPYAAKGEHVLIVFLGFERDRALGLWQSIEPHKTIAVVGRPAYRHEWEGIAEALNAPLLRGLEDTNVRYVDPRNPVATYEFLRKEITEGSWPSGTNFFIAPIGTKPQVVGLYSFLRDFEGAATVVYASPIAHNHEYISHGIGQTWELPVPGRVG